MEKQLPVVGDVFYVDDAPPSSRIGVDGYAGGLVQITAVETLGDNACLCSVAEISAKFRFYANRPGLFSWASREFKAEQSHLKKKFGPQRARPR